MASLQELQSLVSTIRYERGFTMDPVRIFALLTEEIGEVAGELKRTWSPNYEAFSREGLGDELVDVLVCLLALANQFDVDIEAALRKKFLDKDGQRTWKSAERILEESP
jgi:NTP pyrophosphatase (non-canonical NTP hydrolase)